MAKQALLITLFALVVCGAESRIFRVTNKCKYTVFAGALTSAGSPPLSSTGFQLNGGQSVNLQVPDGWSGRIWGRTGCSMTSDHHRLSCLTGDCGSGLAACNGAGGAPPATLIEFTLNGADGKDFYDTSLVDGFNLPFGVMPVGGTGDCKVTGCPADINKLCPSELSVKAEDGSTVGCKSACLALGGEEYCCSGAYGTPDKCKPTKYSKIFKDACPLAYSYAYDDATSTFTCTAPERYYLTFCP